MTDIDRLAQALFGGKRAESQEVSTDATTRTYIGVATSDSAEGTAYVSLDGDVTLPDDIIDPEGNVIESYEDNGIEMSVGPSIHEGDEVIVTLVGGGPLKTPMVTSVAGEGDRQDAAIDDAARAAETAWNWADEAHDAATTAQERADEAAISASEAASSASAAQTSANAAQQSASTAATAAASAQGDAATAASAAANAQADASSALSAATSAQASAASAASDAATAASQASAAQASATRANTAANSALTQLSVVEDVAGTLQWISDHGTFTATTDTTVQEGVVYFTYDGGDYVPIAEPTGDPSAQGWYVLDVGESQTDYIMSHIAVTSRGLWVLPSGIGSAADEQHAAGYKLLLASDGSYLYDSDGQLVTTSGESITLSSSRPQYIGGENAYIIYYDSDDDGIPDTIRIGGHVLMGGSQTLSEVLSELEAATSTEVVGRNLLRKTGSIEAADLARSRSTVPEPGIIRITPTTSAAYAKFKVDYLDFAEYGEGTFTVSFDARLAPVGSDYTTSNILCYLGFSGAGYEGSIFGASHHRYTSGRTLSSALTSDWQRFSTTYNVPSNFGTGNAEVLVAGSQLTVQVGARAKNVPVEVRNVKLERGARATAWTLAPEDLVGITATTVSYGTSASASTEPSDWQATAPTVTQGQWLWTRTVTAYTDGTSTTSYGKSYVGTDGAAGTSVTVSAIEYGTSADGTTQPTSWQSTVPATAQGQWLWTRTSYTDGTSAITKAYIGTDGAAGADGTSVTILGSYNTLAELQAAHPTGSLGDSYIVAGDLYVWDGSAWSNVGAIQGPQGPAGADGASVTVASVAYGTSADASTQPTSWSATAPASIAKGSWLWVRTTYSDSTETVTKSYVGTDGDDGKSVFVQSATKSGDTTTVILSDGTTQTTLTISDGTDGANGTDGLGGYVHTAWANSADGSTGFSTTVSAGKLYLGVYTDHSATDSTTPSDYSWSLIKGADGTSVTVTKTEYGISSSASAQPTWSTTVPTSIAKGKWLWARTTYSDGKTTITKSYVGTDGANGVGMTSIVDQWYLSTSNTSQVDGSWSTTQPEWTVGRYIWQRSLITWDTTPATTTTTEPTLAHALNGVSNMAYTATQEIDSVAGSIRSLASGEGTYVDPDGNTVASAIGTTLVQHADAIELRATRSELLANDANMLLDWNETSNTAKDGPANRYWSHSSYSDYITCSHVQPSDTPEQGIVDVCQFVMSTEYETSYGRAIGFYNSDGPSMSAGQTYTVSWWARATDGAGTLSTFVDSYDTVFPSTSSKRVALTSAWRRVTFSVTATTSAKSPVRIYAHFAAGSTGTIQLCGFKMTAGESAEEVRSYADAAIAVQADKIALKANSTDVYTKTQADGLIQEEVTNRNTAIQLATDAIELRASQMYSTKTDASQMAQPNLIPYPVFSTAPHIGDGWLHVNYTNTSSSAASHYWRLPHCDAVVPGQTYTIMVEIRNWECSSSPSGNYMYVQQIADNQFWGANGVRSDGKEETRDAYQTYVHYADVIGGSMTAHVVKVADTEHLSENDGYLLTYRMYTPPNSTNSFDIRWSLYEGDYSGPYKPYVDQSLAARVTSAEAAIEVQADQISSKVSTTDYTGATVTSLINQSADSVKIQAQHVEIDGTAVFNAISSDVDDAITGKGYATTTQVGTAIDTAKQEVIGEIPTNVSALNNDSGYQNSSQVSTAITNGIGGKADKASAVKRTQRIWYRSNSTTKPSTPGTTSSSWVTKDGDGDAAWTKMHVAISSTHKYVYTCEQYELASGTVGYTPVLRDNTITVIDGGNIITGTVSANAVNASSGTFNVANIPTLTANKITVGGDTLTDALEAKADTGDIPTDLGDLTNNIGYATTTQVGTAKTEAINAAATDATLKANAVQSNLDDEMAARKATYGTCASTYNSTAKVVVCDGFDPVVGATIRVKFANCSTVAQPLLTIQDGDGNTLLSGKPIWNNNAIASANNPVIWGANATLCFVYDGTVWVLAEKAPSYSTTSTTTATTQTKLADVAGALIVNGTTITIRFSTANTYANGAVKLNVSATGATNVYRENAVTSKTNTLTWPANTELTFVRNAQCWFLADNGSRKLADDAAKTATNYVTAIDNDGIWVTPKDAKPVNGAAAATTSGWHISDALELWRKGVNMFKVWADSAAKMWLRLGDEDSGHIIMGPDEIVINNGELEAYKITASAETDEESNTRYESWLELGGAYVHSTEYADSIGNTISNRNALVADNHMGEAAVSAESWVDEHDFYWGRSGSGESEVVATGHSAVNLSGNVLVLDDQHSSGTRTYPFDMTDVIATLRSGAGTILFTGSYSDTRASSVTLSESAANFSLFRVFCQDGDGQVTSVDVDAPQGKTFTVTMSTATQTRLYIKSKSFYINGSSITCPRISNTYYRHGQMEFGTGVSTWDQNAELIGIVKVLGFR